MKFQTFSINKVYDSFDNFLKVVNSHAKGKRCIFAIKQKKKNKKQILYMLWLRYNKNLLYKTKNYDKGYPSGMKNKYL